MTVETFAVDTFSLKFFEGENAPIATSYWKRPTFGPQATCWGTLCEIQSIHHWQNLRLPQNPLAAHCVRSQMGTGFIEVWDSHPQLYPFNVAKLRLIHSSFEHKWMATMLLFFLRATCSLARVNWAAVHGEGSGTFLAAQSEREHENATKLFPLCCWNESRLSNNRKKGPHSDILLVVI